MATTSKGLYVYAFNDSEDCYDAIKKLVNEGDGSANDPKSNMQLIDELFVAVETALNGKAAVLNKTATIGTTWTGGEAPYTQTISVPGMLATDTPLVDLVASETLATAEDEEKDWAKIYRITTADDSITVYAKEQTTNSLSIKLKIVR